MKNNDKIYKASKKSSNIDRNKAKKLMSLHATYEVRWKNFKGFKDTGWKKIKPITIIIGANNSGKSSFIAPLLLMNQTIQSRDSATPLILKGNLYDGGNIKELSNGYDIRKKISFGFRYHTHEPPKRIKKVGEYPPGAFDVTFSIKNDENRDLEVTEENIYDIYNQLMFTFKKDRQAAYNIKSEVFNKSMLPDEREGIKRMQPRNFLFSPNGLLAAARKAEKENDEASKRKTFSSDFSQVLQALSFNFTMASETIGNISYLGPIRDNPHRYYELSNENYNTVGFKGENMVNLLKRNIHKIQEQLNEWIQRFGFGDSVELKPISKTIYSITFNDANKDNYTNIANAGFGASQILPLVVQALLSPPESLTIAEQPEIHLNPKLQSILADLFALMAKKDQRIIVETHSEHLLLRLRRLIAEKTLTKDDLAIYFVEKKNGNSEIREIEVDENGKITSDEWPTGFFDDTLRESLALAAAQAKNRNK